jgi:hypothetical protein
MERVSSDRAQAIVKCVEAVVGSDRDLAKPVELVNVLPGKALIVVGPSKSLNRIHWLRRIEISPTRYLLVLPSGMSVESMELAIIELMENIGSDDQDEHALLKELRRVISYQRHENAISKGEIVFVSMPRK